MRDDYWFIYNKKPEHEASVRTQLHKVPLQREQWFQVDPVCSSILIAFDSRPLSLHYSWHIGVYPSEAVTVLQQASSIWGQCLISFGISPPLVEESSSDIARHIIENRRVIVLGSFALAQMKLKRLKGNIMSLLLTIGGPMKNHGL